VDSKDECDQLNLAHVARKKYKKKLKQTNASELLIEQCLTPPPTQYRLSGKRFYRSKDPKKQYQSTEGTKEITQITEKYNKRTDTKHNKSPSLH